MVLVLSIINKTAVETENEEDGGRDGNWALR
jgi:hypothetical protein